MASAVPYPYSTLFIKSKKISSRCREVAAKGSTTLRKSTPRPLICLAEFQSVAKILSQESVIIQLSHRLGFIVYGPSIRYKSVIL